MTTRERERQVKNTCVSRTCACQDIERWEAEAAELLACVSAANHALLEARQENAMVSKDKDALLLQVARLAQEKDSILREKDSILRGNHFFSKVLYTVT